MSISMIIIVMTLLCLSSVTSAVESALQRADTAYEQADFQRAAIEYYRVLAADPANQQAHLRLANYYLGLRQYDDAMAHAKAVLDQSAQSIEALMIFGLCHATRDESAKAQSYFEQIIALDPRNVGAYYGLGVVMKQSGDSVGSEAAFAKFRSFSGMPADQGRAP